MSHQGNKSASSPLTREQEVLLAEIAHEIRNPMNVLLGFSEILARETYGPHADPRYLDYSRILHRECGKLIRICERLMIDGADDPAGGRRYQSSIGPAVERIHQMFGKLAEDRGVKLETVIDPNFPALNIDPDVLDSVFDNLISNAIKFTPSGGSVTVKAKVGEDGAVILVICDTGVGMSWGGQKLRQPKAAANSPHGDKGFGLGLGIIERELERRGARLEIDSEEGKGTTAKVVFPSELIA